MAQFCQQTQSDFKDQLISKIVIDFNVVFNPHIA